MSNKQYSNIINETIININKDTIHTILNNLLKSWGRKKYSYLIGYELSEEEKDIILCKIHKYISENPDLIQYVDKLMDKKCNRYKKFIFKCAEETVSIYKYIKITEFEENLLLTLLENKTINSSNYYFYKFEVSETFLYDHIKNYSFILYRFYNLKVDFVENLINNFKYDKKTLRSILHIIINRMDKERKENEYLYTRFDDECHEENYEPPVYKLLTSNKMIDFLISIEPDYYAQFYVDWLNFKVSNFDVICALLSKYKNPEILKLYNLYHNDYEDEEIKIPEDELLKLTKINAKVLDLFDCHMLLDKYGNNLFCECIKLHASSIKYFQDNDIEIDYYTCLELNTMIVEFIDNPYKLIEILIYCLNNISRNHLLFISENTYDKYFLDASNSFYALHPKDPNKTVLPMEINKIVISYLI